MREMVPKKIIINPAFKFGVFTVRYLRMRVTG